MLKQVIGAVMAITVAVILLTMIIPMLTTVKNSVFERLPNQTNPTNQELFQIANYSYLLIIFIVVGVTIFVVFLYASNRDPFDVNQ